MRTEELINALAEDGARPAIPIGRVLSRAFGLGAFLSLALFSVILRPRADFGQAINTIPFNFKLGIFALVAAVAAGMLAEMARPVPAHRWRRPLLLAPVLLAIGIVVELAAVPAQAWVARLTGHNAGHCVAFVPLLSLPIAGCLLAALRRGAPQHPVLAGAAAGLVSGGVGALLYGLSCPDDSPLFVATWYSIALAIVTGVTAGVGHRFLRW